MHNSFGRLNIRSYSGVKEDIQSSIFSQKNRISTSLSANPRQIDVGGGANNNFAKELLKHSLLTAKDEFELARHFRVGVQIQAQAQLLEKEQKREPTLVEIAQALDIPAHTVEPLLERGEESKRKLVRANMRLVFHISRYYKFRGVAYPDLVQEGTFGLIKAVERYDPDRGFRFSTYASWWIKQAVSRAVAEKSRIIRLPVHVHDMMVSIARVERQFAARHSRKPTSAEIADRLALPLQKVELLVKCSRDVNSIDESVYQNRGKMVSNDVQVKDRIQSTSSMPSVINEKNSLRSELRRAMENLSEREADIVRMRFGLGDGNPMTLEEIGKHFSVTRERIRQIEARALSKMRHPGKKNELKEIFQDHSLLSTQASPSVVTAAAAINTATASVTSSSTTAAASASGDRKLVGSTA